MKGYLFYLIAIAIFFTGCEREIHIELPQSVNKLVVEGHVEPGMPTYVILTRNLNFFSGDAIGSFSDLFVHGAHVRVSDGDKSVVLPEYCLNDLPPSMRPMIYQFLGLDVDEELAINVCAYISFDMMGEIGKSYALEIITDDDLITAQTFLPAPPILDSLWTIRDEQYGDSLVVLWAQFNDPDTLGNFYRYFTSTNSEPFYPGYFGSVTDDKLFNGQSFNMPVDKGYARGSEINFSTYGLFSRGDTITLKLAMIDRAHFNFWNTIEEQMRSGGPFSSPTYIKSNITGGLGVWGGYSPTTRTVIVP